MLTACSLNDPTYAEATSRLESHIKVAANLVAAPDTVNLKTVEDVCEDFLNITTDIHPYSEYDVPLELAGEDPDSLIPRIKKVWEGRGFVISHDVNDSYVGIDAVSEDGYTLNAAINYDAREVQISGHGPCTDQPR